MTVENVTILASRSAVFMAIPGEERSTFSAASHASSVEQDKARIFLSFGAVIQAVPDSSAFRICFSMLPFECVKNTPLFGEALTNRRVP
jgi:hypothetical protein